MAPLVLNTVQTNVPKVRNVHICPIKDFAIVFSSPQIQMSVLDLRTTIVTGEQAVPIHRDHFSANVCLVLLETGSIVKVSMHHVKMSMYNTPLKPQF